MNLPYLVSDTTSLRSVNDNNSFSWWFNDNAFFAKRLAFELPIYYQDSSGEYTFDCESNNLYGNTADHFFAPVTQLGLLSKAWPLSNLTNNQVLNTWNCYGPEGIPGNPNSALCEYDSEASVTATGSESGVCAGPCGPRNFAFCTEVGPSPSAEDTRTWHSRTDALQTHTYFGFKGTEQFSFTGDDDVMVYINYLLAIDMGGTHVEYSATIDLTLP